MLNLNILSIIVVVIILCINLDFVEPFKNRCLVTREGD
jgi:hypothetical protein